MLMLGAGVVFGYLIYRSMPQTAAAMPAAGGELRVMVGAMTGGGLLGFAVAPVLSRVGSWFGRCVDSRIRKVSTHGVISGAVGMIVGLIIANLLVIPVASIPELGSYLGIALNVFFAVTGLIVGYHKREEVIPIHTHHPLAGSSTPSFRWANTMASSMIWRSLSVLPERYMYPSKASNPVAYR
jgi:uncharacterized protein YacL